MTTTAPTWMVTRTVGPAGKPVDVADLKASLFLPTSDTFHDSQLAHTIDAATDQFEADTARVCLTSTFIYFADAFPPNGAPFRLPLSPIQTVEQIRYLDPDLVTQTLDESVYRLIPGETYVRLAVGEVWPEHYAAPRTVEITFTAGHGNDSTQVPELYRHAIRMLSGFLWQPDGPDSETWNRAYQNIVQSLLPNWPQGNEQ